MKIIRYLFQQLIKCAFEYVNFGIITFNSQMIELLFDENKTNIPLQFHSQKHIETSKNLSKMVKRIDFDTIRGPLTLSEQAENIEIKVKNNNLKSTKYQISNKNNPEIKFSIHINEKYESSFYVEITRIN
uniref:Uncharacterized protein n=1 Tax=Meloidogyne enterolobii TaxID=390850 RepID=A0A6V7UCT7_MELEN|nr:unnamed protein product [Meloidogyne enterolobii]